jgi:hypothetical protein
VWISMSASGGPVMLWMTGSAGCENSKTSLFWLLSSYVIVLLNWLREHVQVIDERIALPRERAPHQYVPWGHNGQLKLFRTGPHVSSEST